MAADKCRRGYIAKKKGKVEKRIVGKGEEKGGQADGQVEKGICG